VQRGGDRAGQPETIRGSYAAIGIGSFMPNAGLCRIGPSQYLRSGKLHGFSAAGVGIMIIPYQTDKNNAKVRPFRNSAVDRRRGTLIPGWVLDGFKLS
jgi:hypothetical protein